MSRKKEPQIIKVVTSDRGTKEYFKTTIDSYFCVNGSGESNGASRGEIAITHSFLLDSYRKILGKVLTVIDSSISDERQNKAMKDIIKEIISKEMEFSAMMCFDQKELQKDIPDDVEGEEVDIEEVLGVEK